MSGLPTSPGGGRPLNLQLKKLSSNNNVRYTLKPQQGTSTRKSSIYLFAYPHLCNPQHLQVLIIEHLKGIHVNLLLLMHHTHTYIIIMHGTQHGYVCTRAPSSHVRCVLMRESVVNLTSFIF
jgi:hypothetical protein